MKQEEINKKLLEAVSDENVSLKDVKELISAGADVNYQNDWEQTCFDIACRRDNAEIAKLLLQDERFDASKVFDECLHMACFMGQDKLVKVMLEDGRFDVNKKNQNGQTPLMCACEKDRADVVKLLLQDKRTKVNVMDNEGKAALEYTNDMEIVGLFRKAAVKRGVEENKDKFISNKEKIKNLKARISGEPKINKSDEHKRKKEVSFVVSMKSNDVNDK